MTDQYVLSIDPGKSTGIALLGYNDNSVWLESAWQFGGGIAGLLSWMSKYHFAAYYDREWGEDYAARIILDGPTRGLTLSDEVQELYDDASGEYEERVVRPQQVTVIAEKFTARSTHGFSYTTDSLEPLRGEGALIALGLMPDYTPSEKRWRDPNLQYLVGGKDKADKKKRQHKFLKDAGFYVTPKSLGTADADDVRSALSHGLAYLQRDLKHCGVHDMVTVWMESN